MKPRIGPVAQPGRMVSYFLAARGTLAAVVVCGLFFNVTTVIVPTFQGRMIDAVAGGAGFVAVCAEAARYALFVLLVQTARYGKRFSVRRFANRTGASMRFMLYHSLLCRPAAELDGASVGDLMSRAVSDVELTVEGMRKATTEVFDSGVLMTSYAVVMCLYDPVLTVMACLFLPLALLLASRLGVLVYRFGAASREAAGAVSAQTYEAVEGALLLRVCGLQEAWAARCGEALGDLAHKAARADVLENAMRPVYQAIAGLGVAAVVLRGGAHVLDGVWTIGRFSAYLTMFLALTAKAGRTAKLFNSVQKSRVSWKRVQPLLREYAPFPAALPTGRAAPLSVRGLTFCYADGREAAVSGVSFTAEPGRFVGVTGPVACGKSALGLAFLGLYPYGGSIRVGGRELRDIPQEERAGLVAYLGHETELLSDSIYENVAFGDGGDVTGVLADVCFLPDLAAMPAGVQTRVGPGGARLSGGQQARLALARALYRGAPVLVLDDPFSAVDRRTELEILANLRAHYAERVIVLISHRLSAFPALSEVLLLEKGRVAARGTHDSLMGENALYRAIYELQREGEA